MKSKQQARALADVSTGIILAEVEIAAPPERVFTALTSQEVTAWWGDAGTYRTTDWIADLRVGGRWKASGVGADGRAFAVEGEYLVIEPPRRIVQTWRPDWVGGQPTTLTYSLAPAETGTLLTVRHEGFNGDQAESCRSHAGGWEKVLGWLQAWLSAAPAPAPELRRYLLRLVPPRKNFASDATAREREVMARHAAYWGEHLRAGRVVMFGPVLDPAGPWGMAALEVKDENELNALKDADPALAGIPGMRWEVLPFLRAVVRPFAS
ncbi:SRPBCC domain-containing protein [Ramlibacter sp. MMS24-I3-19]|uniref:SRPBCC domain-containing protein n=1 Tax=Ramlibacter sp. MMS24-I3-19 TaxID=3416606 RepID=UPI003D0817AF